MKNRSPPLLCATVLALALAVMYPKVAVAESVCRAQVGEGTRLFKQVAGPPRRDY